MQLGESLETAFRLTPRQRSALRRLGIRTRRDLLFHFPARYEELGAPRTIRELRQGEKATVIARVVELKPEKTWRKKIKIAGGLVEDATGRLPVVWFNQPYVAKILKPGTWVRLSGRVSAGKRSLMMANPLYEPAAPGAVGLFGGREGKRTLLPIYPETYGITSRWLRYQIERTLRSLSPLPETLPQEILQKYRLPSFDRAIRAVHFPRTLGEADASRKRFAFGEIFLMQLNRQRERKKLEAERGLRIETNTGLMKHLVEFLPFRLTNAQRRAIWQILQDFKKPQPMARLLEGDVGSGKTVVAAACALNVVAAGYQVAYMAPTEILARQHFEEFMKRLAPFKVRMGLLTSSEARKFPSRVNPKTSTHISKNQILRWCLSGEIQILIGTHALIEDRVKFKNLAFVVIDEQHRFGIEQRAAMAVRKTDAKLTRETDAKLARPHFLSMSATPIPRTLALTIYADLDLTVLDEMPPGREPVETEVVSPREREKIYEFIREEIKRGGQVFVICPRIETKQKNDTPLPHPYSLSPRQQAKLDWSDVRSVKAEYKKLSEEIFSDLAIGMVHGKLKPREKETVMRKFKSGELDILVSTSVVEVGVDVPNASIMMIEGGERFGLAQLHQFRGRVGRGSRKSYCFVFTTGVNHAENRRLKALQEVKTGFELAEYDLQFRGPGELSGRKQWGISDIGMEALKNIKMVEAARTEAQALIAKDPELTTYPSLKERIEKTETAVHFE